MDAKSIPTVKYYFDSDRVIKYIIKYLENPNSMFFMAQANCTNFVSQVLWYGFGGIDNESERKNRMTDTWYASKWGISCKWKRSCSYSN